MTNTTKHVSTKTFWLILLVALWSFGIKAQSYRNPVLVWDKEVGCIDRQNEKGDRDNYTLWEYVKMGYCLRVCEDSYVQYTFSDNDYTQVEWEVAGGQIMSSSNTHAGILWGAAGNGNLTLKITYANNTTSTIQLCVEKIQGPSAKFRMRGVEPDQHEFCLGMPILFENLSSTNGGTDLIDYFWDFGDGNTSNTFEPTHTYREEGKYSVELTVTNSCNCSTTYKTMISINKAEAFEISCPSIVCANSLATYSVNDRCGGNWKVSGGHIVDRTETSIEVKWDNVAPEDGFGYVSYRSNCSCPHWTTVKVPVILPDVPIKGREVICQGTQSLFSLPQWPATEFTWMINGDPYHYMLVHTDQRNEIIVNGYDPGAYELSVKYTNTLIDEGRCGGNAKRMIKVTPKPQISTDPALTICPGTPKTFTSSDNSSAQWNVELNGTNIRQTTGSTFNYDFPYSGTYIISADYGGCITNPIIVEAVENEAITGKIDGSDKVCLRTPYTYKITENEPGYFYTWSVTQGSIIGTNTGQQVDVVFTGSGTVSVTKQFVRNGVTCKSDPIHFDVAEARLNPIIINNSGLSEFCPSSRTTFSVDLGGIVPDHIAWSIESIGGDQNFANIISGINSETVTVNFNEVSSSPQGILTVAVTKCGEIHTKTYNIRLIDTPTITLAPLGDICPGDPRLLLQLTSNQPIAGSLVRVSFDGNTPIGPYVIPTNGVLNIENKFENNTTGNISRSITVMMDICQYKVQTSQTVTVYPLTEVDITPGYRYTVCPSNPRATTIQATVSTGLTNSVQFKWYKAPNTLLPEFTGPTLTVGMQHFGGQYYVEVTDINGCVVRSKEIDVKESCGGSSTSGPGCTISPDPDLRYRSLWSACDEITITAYSSYPPTSVHWTGSPHLTLDPTTQNTTEAVFKTTVPGQHIVTGTFVYGNCSTTQKFYISKNYDPILKTAISCNGDGTYQVVLHNNSRISGVEATDITYRYTDPNGLNVSNQTGNSHTINNVVPGQYLYTLTLSMPGEPDCSMSVPVNLEPEQRPNFSLAPLTYCADDPVTLTLPAYDPRYRYKWIFNNTSYIATSLHTEVQFPGQGRYAIELEITTPYGCTYRSTNNVEILVNKANFTRGDIQPDSADFCASQAVPLRFTPGPSTSSILTDIIWMLGNQAVGQGLTYQPIQSGSYWPVLIDQNGCKDYIMSKDAHNYTLRQPPFASINGNTSVCFNESTTLTGIATDENVQFRWTGHQIPTALGNWSTSDSNKTLALNGLSPGSYEFTFHTRIANDNSCVNSYSVVVTVHPVVARPTISYTLINCQPYTLRLTASGPATGTYNWSNGSNGQSIEVHLGGAYRVTYTETTGCSEIMDIQVPHSPERSLWVVPAGCYTVCNAYLLGPLGRYQQYQWLYNEGTTQSGIQDFIPNEQIHSGGNYQLFITQQGCTYGSNRPTITFDPERCPKQECSMKAEAKLIEQIPGGLRYEITISSGTGQAQTIHLSSANGYGTFVPALHPISGGITVFIVDFYTNGTYSPGVHDTFVINGLDCSKMISIRLDEIGWRSTAVEIPYLTLSPNPTATVTTAAYSIGTAHEQAQYLVVYDLLGVQRYKQKITAKKAEVVLEMGHLAQGTYLICLEADGKRIATEKLIKK